MATLRTHSFPPQRWNASTTWSSSPTDMPPALTITSARAAADWKIGPQFGRLVDETSEIDDLDPWLCEQAAQDETIGVIDLAGLDAFAGLPKLGAGREHRHAKLAEYANAGIAAGRGDARLQRSHLRAGLDQAVARPDVLAPPSDVVARSRRTGENDAVAFAPDIFLGDDGIGAGGDRRARQDAKGAPVLQHRLSDGAARGDAAGHFQPGWKFGGQAGRVDGISVHRAVIEPRQRLIRLDGLGENPAAYVARDPPVRSPRSAAPRPSRWRAPARLKRGLAIAGATQASVSWCCSNAGILPPPGLSRGISALSNRPPAPDFALSQQETFC